MMADIRRLVERIVESDPVIRKGLRRRLINSRALARYIQESDGVDATLDAILGIIRRYPQSDEREETLGHVFRDCEIAMRNRMADLAIENSSDVMKSVSEFAATVKTTRGENLRVVVGLRSIRVMAEQKILEIFRQTLRPKDIISYTTDLAEISLLFAPGASEIKGVAARIATQLALNDVNVAGLFFCCPEDIVIIAEKDAPRALEALQRLLKEETASYSGSVDESKHGLRRPRDVRKRISDAVVNLSQNR